VLTDAERKFLRGSRVAQMNAANFSAAAAEMHMRVNETRQDAFALCIDLLGCRAHPFCDFRIPAHGNNAASQDRYCFGLRMQLIHGPHVSMNDHKVSVGSLLRFRAGCSEQQETKR
jgi:hypothetical protein